MTNETPWMLFLKQTADEELDFITTTTSTTAWALGAEGEESNPLER